jgi:hypothetical protein
MIKKARNENDAWKLQETYKDLPHGWIQWKGTKVCMDIWCACGEHFHIDEDFAYYVQCPECERIYFCNGHIELIELLEKPKSECIAQDVDKREEKLINSWIEEVKK